MNKFFRLLRPQDYVILYSLPAVISAFFTSNINLFLIPLVVFIIFSSAFGFVVNDLSDLELDKSAGKTRNPLVSGEITTKTATKISLCLFSLSMLTLSVFSFNLITLGIIANSIYLTYSFIIRAKTKPFLDLIWHISPLAIFTTMGYTLYKPFDLTCLSLVLIASSISALAELENEIRDHKTDREMIETTVTKIGVQKALILYIIILLTCFLLIVPLYLTNAIPLELLFFLPFAYFVLTPLIKVVNNQRNLNVKIWRTVHQRVLVIGTVFLTVLIILK